MSSDATGHHIIIIFFKIWINWRVVETACRPGITPDCQLPKQAVFHPGKMKNAARGPYRMQQSKLKFHSSVANQHCTGWPRQACKQNNVNKPVMGEREREGETDTLRGVGLRLDSFSADEGALAFSCLHTHTHAVRERRHTLKDTHSNRKYKCTE